MSFFSWLRNRNAGSTSRRRQSRSYRPRCEMLEARDLLAAVIVTNVTDELNGDTSSIAALMSRPGADGISLREAILASNETAGANNITFDPVTSGLPILLTHDHLEIKHAVTITGLGAANTTVNGQGNSRIINVAPALDGVAFDVTLDGLTLTSGGKAYEGGAIRTSQTGTLLTVKNSIISNNRVHSSIFNNYVNGGGIWSYGPLTVINSTVSGNSADDSGGGIYSQGVVTVIDSTISGNSAGGGQGGGIASSRTVIISNSTISDNRADGGGGGIAARNVTISNSTVSRNSSDWAGGGIYARRGDIVTISGSTISDNYSGYGGGIFGDDLTVITVINSTITGHRLAEYGGGIFSFGVVNVNNSTISGNSASFGGGIFVEGTLTLHNSIVAGNVDVGGNESWNGYEDADSPDLYGLYGIVTLTNSLIGDNSRTGLDPTLDGMPDIDGNLIGTATAPINPLLGPLANNGGPTQTMALLTGSPALNAGNNRLTVNVDGVPLLFDQRGPGFARISGGNVDMGAYELQVNAAPTITAPAAQTAYEDVTKPISGLSVGDSDGDNLTVTLQVGHGSLNLSNTVGLNVAGNGSGSVTLVGSVANLNAALAGLVYCGGLNFSGDDMLAITASDGSLMSSNRVALTVRSAGRQALDLQTQLTALWGAGVLNRGQSNSMFSKLNLNGNNGDAGKVTSLLNEINAMFNAGNLSQDQADALTATAKILRTSLTRR